MWSKGILFEFFELVLFFFLKAKLQRVEGAGLTKKLTSDLVINLDLVECLAAEGATVGLDGPFSQARVMENMATNLDFCNVILGIQT